MISKQGSEDGFQKEFTLPAELRNLIYEQVVPHDTTIGCYGWYPFRLPPITQVCRTLRAETLSLFYKRNEFDLIPAYYTSDSLRHDRVERGLDRRWDRRWLLRYGPELPGSNGSPIGILGEWIQRIGTAHSKIGQGCPLASTRTAVAFSQVRGAPPH